MNMWLLIFVKCLPILILGATALYLAYLRKPK